MNKFEFLLNLDQYRNYKPKNVLYHDSYDIPKKETHKIQPGYSRAPKIYKDQISLYEEYNSEVIAHRGDMKYYQKIENFYGPGKSRYFYSKEEWDTYQDEKNKMYDKAREAQAGRDAAMKNSQKRKIHTIDPRDDRVIEYDEDGSNARKLNTTWQQHRQGAIMEADRAIERSLKEGGMKSGINAILRDDRMEEFFTQFEGGFENHGWDLTKNGKVTGMSDDDKKYVKDIENWARKFTDSEGNSLFESDEFQDAVMKEIRNRYKIAQDYKNDPDREKKDAEEDAYWEEENQKAGEAMDKALKSVHDEEDSKDVIKKYTYAAKEDPKKAAKQILKNQDLGLYEAIGMIKYYMQNGYLQYKDGKFITDNSDVNKGINQLLDEVQRQVNKVGNASGTDRAIQKELDRLLQAKFQRMNDKYAV